MSRFQNGFLTLATVALTPVAVVAQWIEPPVSPPNTIFTLTDRVGINVVPGPNYRLNVNGNQFIRGQLRIDNYRNHIMFGTGLQGAGGQQPMIYQFNSGTSNDPRMVIAHSPAFSDWGLQYVDLTDTYRWLRAGAPVMDIGSGVDIYRPASFDARVDLNADVALGANAMITTDVRFRDASDTITFPEVTIPNPAPIMRQFSGGTQNVDRMVIAHSEAFDDWGLQYRDSSDQYHFLGDGNTAMAIDLGRRRVSIGNDNPNVTGNADVRLVLGQQNATNLVAGTSFFTWSSRRFKDDIEPLADDEYDQMLQGVVDSPLFHYRYAEDSPDKTRIGVMVEDSAKEVIGDSPDGVDMSLYVSALHAATIAQQRRIEAQDAQLAELRTALQDLLNR